MRAESKLFVSNKRRLTVLWPVVELSKPKWVLIPTPHSEVWTQGSAWTEERDILSGQEGRTPSTALSSLFPPQSHVHKLVSQQKLCDRSKKEMGNAKECSPSEINGIGYKTAAVFVLDKLILIEDKINSNDESVRFRRR